MKLNTIEEALKDLGAGKMIIVVDDENRENEGDIVIAAQSVTPEIINTMVKISSGLICVPVAQEIAKKLELHPMVESNSAHFGVNFTISIDAAHGISTGASAADKAVTIKQLINPDARPEDFVRPGHIFPLIAKKGGVLTRPGHTEAAVDLAFLAGFPPVAVISEVTNEDGGMARMPELHILAEKMDLKIISIKDLITYRHRTEQIFFETTRVALPTNHGKFTLHVFENNIDQQVGFALTTGVFSDHPTLVRVHSECFTGDTFGSLRCDCGEQLETAMELLQKEKAGILIYLKQEGRGIGLLNKIKAYKIQEQGLDTIEANRKLGFSSDLRNYALAAHILRYLNVTTINLLTNNPHKMSDLESYGITVAQRIPLEGHAHDNNKNYLFTKKNKMGHWLSNV